MIDERGIDLFYRQQERLARAKTLVGECETLIDAIQAFIATLLREIRKPLLRLYVKYRPADRAEIDGFTELTTQRKRTFFQKMRLFSGNLLRRRRCG